jgi:N-acetylneuraminic acid mutarotase
MIWYPYTSSPANILKMLSRLLIVAFGFLVLPLQAAEPKPDPLPVPLSNNAVAGIRVGKQHMVFSLMGIGPNKSWKEISNAAYQLNLSSGKWGEIRPVPGTAGRLGAAAAGAHEQLFMFGGYVVDAQGGETTVSDVNIYDPVVHRWYRGADMPVPVDDSVIGVYRDRYIYLVSGWSKNEAVHNVQMYDSEKDTWRQATAIPGTPVFGHSGALLDDTIIYVDGAHKNPAGDQPRYVASDECWMGKIDHHDPSKIEWTKIETHPGNARYRIAAGASSKDQKIYFSGGTDNPYNYNGIGYDGHPAEPVPVTFAWNLRAGKWEVINENISNPSMDHRGLVATPMGLLLVGGMRAGQKVTAQVDVIPIHR